MPDNVPSNVIPFPRQLRVVRSMDTPSAPAALPADLVEHDGQAYRLEDLLGRLTFEEKQMAMTDAVWSWQGIWDAVVRRWPALAAEIIAAARPLR